MNLEAVFFDFDGVIVDSIAIKTDAFGQIYHQFGNDIEKKVIDYHLLNGGISRFDKFRYWHKNYLNIEINSHELDELGSQFSDLVFQKIIEADYVEGVLETLSLLKSHKIPTYIVSGTPDNEIKQIVSGKDLNIFFDEVHGSPRSKEVIVEEILSREFYDPMRCLFVGDSLSDLNAALCNNLQFLGIIHSENKSLFPTNTATSNRVDLKNFI